MGKISAERDHEELSESIEPELMDTWEAQEAEALQNRRRDIKAMDIYEVRMERGRPLFAAVSFLLLNSLIFSPKPRCKPIGFGRG